MLKKISGWFWLTLLVVGGTYLFTFQSLFLNISTHLPDWNDYPFYVWTIYQHVDHIRNFQFFNGFFTGNIFYPYQGNLLFSDLLLPQGVFAFIGSFVSPNPILVFNSIFFFTLFLNILAVWFFWTGIFNDKKHVFLSTFLFCISGIVFQNSVHFQILSFWPFFLAMGVLVRNHLTRNNAVFVGVLLGLQFTSGAYLAIFFLFALGFWYLSLLLNHKLEKPYLVQIFKHAGIIIFAFLLLAGIFLEKYLQVKQAYGVTRLYWEYIYYSSNITDYLFSNHYRSFAALHFPMKKWNSLNHAGSLYPGIILIAGTFWGLGIITKIKNQLLIGIRLQHVRDYFFFFLLCWGFIASLGPRLRVNDVYSSIPLPYDIVVRIFPLVEPIRVNARWGILFFMGMIYFTILGLKRLKSPHELLLIAVAVVIVLIEIVPLQVQTEAKAYYDPSYVSLEAICQENSKVLFEYPMTQDKEKVDIVSNLTYRSQQMLASIKHKCTLVNGYMGYEPPDYARYEQEISNTVNNGLRERFWELLQEKHVSYVKINVDDLYPTKVTTIRKFLENQPGTKIISQNDQAIIIATGL